MINNSEFILKEIPKINPVLDEYVYKEFWSAEKRKCIEGTWVGGLWCPPTLYYHSNFAVIPLEAQTASQAYGKPFMRDIDWEFYRYYEEARGFSGFELDDEYSCHRALISNMDDAEIIRSFCINIFNGEIVPQYYNNIFKVDGSRKNYIPARDYIAKVHAKGNLGKPIYNNNSQNLSVLGSRGAGKSLWASSCVITNWHFGGAKDYDEYLKALTSKQYQISATIIGAYEKKYTAALQKYILESKDFLRKNNLINYGGIDYNCPLFVNHSGSSQINNDSGLISAHGSVLLSRSFSEQAVAANSTRPNLAVIDEVGFAKNIEDVIGSIAGSEASKKRKILTMLFLGTGGYSRGSSITHFQRVYYSPEEYNCLAFPDIWEGRGNIGWFIPVSKANLNYKDPANNYITDLEYAERKEKEKRAAIKDPKALALEKVNAPMFPSEIFLAIDGTKFPAELLKEQESQVMGGVHKDKLNASWKGWLKFDNLGKVFFENSPTDMPIRTYPLLKADDYMKKGAVEMWAKPKPDSTGNIPHRRYIGGVDVVAKDIANTESLPSLIIMDTYTGEIVLEYTGRTDRRTFFYEQVRRAAIYYNALIMYENNISDMFTYFKKEKSLHYLADTPKDLRNQDTWKVGADNSKGINANEKIIASGESMILDWLLTPIKPNSDELILNTIYSPALLNELIKHDGELNTDRVSALIQLMWFKNSMVKVEREDHIKRKDAIQDYYMKRGLIAKRNNSGNSNTDYKASPI